MGRIFNARRLLPCVLLVLASRSYGQYGFRNWTVDDGLPRNSIRDILQRRDSYLWLATNDGLARFDGVRFTVFNRQNTSGALGNRITALYEDRDGSLWIGGDGSVTRLHNGVFTGFGGESGIPRSAVQGITGDASGNVWILFPECVMRWRQGRLERLANCPFRSNRLAAGPIIHYPESAGFWSQNSGLSTFIDGKASYWGVRDGYRPNISLQRVALDEHRVLWVGGSGKLFRSMNGRLVPVPLPSACSPSAEFTFVKAPKLKLVCQGSGSSFFISTPDGTEQERLAADPPFLQNSQAFFQMVFYEDPEGILWAGTEDSGLWRARKQAIVTLSEAQGLGDHNVYPILQDRSGAIWIAAWPGTLNRYQHGRIQHFTLKDGVLPFISALYEDHAGRLWVASYQPDGDGLRIFRNGRFVPPARPRKLGQIHAIFEDLAGALWFGCEDKLVRLRGNVTDVFTTRDGLATNYVNTIVEDRDGNLWFGGHGGITRLSGSHFTGYTVHDGLPSPTVRALYADPENVLWIGTYDGGLARFEKGKFTTYTTRDGLFSDGVFQIFEDSQGNLWMGSNQGIYHLRKRQLNDFAAGKVKAVTSIAYGEGDGMLSAECNGGHWPAGIRARDGTLWFPTQNGVAIVNPAKLPENPNPPTVVIESLRVNGRPVPVNAPVRLGPGQNSFEARYTAFAFADAERIHFKYKLEGLDTDWTNAGTRRVAYYTHVPPGKYVFEVIAADGNGTWNAAGKSLEITLLPHFYQTWWFLLLSSIVGGSLLFLAVHYRLSSFRRAQAAQLAFSRQLIASQENERQRIAAALHDSLGQRLIIIKNLALLLLQARNGDGPLAGRDQERVAEICSEATGAVGEVKEISYNLRPYRLDRLGLTVAVQAMIEAASAASTTSFSSEIDNIDDVFTKDNEINFYRIVQECMNNVLKHAEAEHALVRIRANRDRVLLIVQDDGRGFAPDSAHSGSPGGFGLTGISERAQLLGGRAAIQSTPGQGTIVTVSIPV